MRVGSLFAGIGGFELGFERAGFEVAWQVEIDPWCRRVLAKHWPNVPKYEDVRNVGSHNLEWVDVLIGGFPCQDVSDAGKREGIDGARSGLWGEYARLISELRPRYAVVENVPGLLRRGFGRVVGDLAEIGYDAEWECLPAAAFGAPHIRDRVFIVAYPRRIPGPLGQVELFRSFPNQQGRKGAHRRSEITHGNESRMVRYLLGGSASDWWQAQSRMARSADGLAYHMDRLRGLGNAVVPQVAQYVAECVKAHAQATGQWVEAA